MGKCESMRAEPEPPPYHTEASLLSAMERAGRNIEDAQLSKIMRDCGLGTSATRASIIETIIKREYIIREQKFLKATPKGEYLIDRVSPKLKSPELTGEWESLLGKIARENRGDEEFMHQITEWLKNETRQSPQNYQSDIPIDKDTLAKYSHGAKPQFDLLSPENPRRNT